ncbi:MAG: AraC family transcriptional regulator [Planctomycetota bacterium]
MKEITSQIYRERMLRVLVHIQQNLDEELSLEHLADVAHFSPYHFHRIFRGMIGESLKGHIRRLRLERAAMRLKNGDQSVIMIALEAGYETHEAFSRAFKSMCGRSPSDFRAGQESLFMDSAPSKVHYQNEGELQGFKPIRKGVKTMKVEIRSMEPMRVAFVRHTGPYDQCGTAWEKLCSTLGAKGWLGPGVQFMGLCHDDPEVTPSDKIRYDACVKVDETFQPEGDIGVQVVPGGEFAVTTHLGPYNNLGKTYATLCGRWMPQNNRELRSAPSMEFYLNDPEGTDPEDLITDIYMPVEPK